MGNRAREPGRHLSLVPAERISDDQRHSWHERDEAPGLSFSEVRSSADRTALQRFHYRVNVMDMNQTTRRQDQRQTNVPESQNGAGVQLLALNQSDIVGAIQINYASARDLGVDADFYRMREFAGAKHPSGTCIFSRLLVDPDFRGSTLGRRLCAEAYRNALNNGARTAFLRCSDALVFYFSALGFKPYIGRTRHADYGEVLPMKLDLLDEAYLAMINSPFVPELRAWKQSRTPTVNITVKPD